VFSKDPSRIYRAFRLAEEKGLRISTSMLQTIKLSGPSLLSTYRMVERSLARFLRANHFDQ